MDRGEKKDTKKRKVEKSFYQTANGRFYEICFDEKRDPPVFFATLVDGEIKYVEKLEENNSLIVPVLREDLFNETVYLPSRCEEYSSEDELFEQVKGFIHRYSDIRDYEDIVTVYVFFTWVFDRFTVVPYLRVMNPDEGVGKTRFLMTVGSLCYKPIFCSGATTTSPIFRLIELFGGTLVIDEADLEFSTDTVEFVKILNCGYMKDMPVLRSEPLSKGKFGVVSFRVFCPKIVATKREYKDKNLESRFIFLPIEPTDREDIPINLPFGFREEALTLRNKLLLWRLRKFPEIKEVTSKPDPRLNRRSNQIILPLLSIIKDPKTEQKIRTILLEQEKNTAISRGLGIGGEVVEVIKKLGEKNEILSIGNITELVNEKQDKKLRPQEIGKIIRSTLGLLVKRSGGPYVVDIKSEKGARRFKTLLQRYDLNEESPPANQQPVESKEDCLGCGIEDCPGPEKCPRYTSI